MNRQAEGTRVDRRRTMPGGMILVIQKIARRGQTVPAVYVRNLTIKHVSKIAWSARCQIY
jgi:hypothetical protein